MNEWFDGKVALVTGAGSGIGLATAKAFAQAGASVVLADIQEAKHGVIGLTQTAALEYAARGVRINAVCPGTIKTPMVQAMISGDSRVLTDMVQGEPIGRLGEPGEIAAAVLWLCSPGASFVVGHALLVDGGYTAR